jgi:hypothetical protein
MSSTMLFESLHTVRRRIKMLSVAFGVGIVVASAVAVIITTIFLDWLFDLPAVPRLVFMAASLGGIGWAVTRWIVQPALSRLSLSDMAGRLENAFPVFSDRLRSTVNFVGGADASGSGAMKDRVVAETTQLAERVDLHSAVVVKPVLLSAAGGFAAIVLLAVLAAAVGREYLNPAIGRLFNPFHNQPWPRRVQISATPLPTRVPMGSKINVLMKLTKGDKPTASAIVFYQYDNGVVQMLNMGRDKDGVFLAALDAKGGQLTAWIKSGDDETKPVTVAVVPRLSLQNVELLVTPPKYAAMEPFTADLSARPAAITFGSDVSLRLKFNKPLEPAKPVVLEPIRENSSLPKMQWTRANASQPTATWNARESMRFRVRATDTDGFVNGALEEYELLVMPDQLPRVVIEQPTEKMFMTPEATLHAQIRAEDDFDIRSMQLIVDRVRRADKATTQPSADHWTVDLKGWQKLDRVAEFQPFRLNHDLVLSKLAAQPLVAGDVLEYYAQVRDNFELDGQVHPPVLSRRMELAIISQKELDNAVIEKLRQVAEEVAQVQNTQKNTKESTRQLQEDSKNKPEFDKADHAAAEKRLNEQSTVASQTRTLAQRLSQLKQMLEDNKSPNEELKELTHDVKDNLERAAEQPMKEATNKLAEANRQKSDPKASDGEKKKGTEQRNDALSKAQEHQQKSSDQLQAALDRMQNIGTLQKAIESVQKILEKQQKISAQTAKIGKENLGKKPEEMSKEAREAQNKNAKEQSDLAKETQKATDEMQKTAEQMSKSDKPASDAMKEAAQTAQQQAVGQKQQDAAEAADQNQQAKAQNNQKQAELGLQMMLDTLREAEKRKLEKLAKQLDDGVKAVENLVRQQAGHNVNNLLTQGGDKAKLATDDLLRKAKLVRDHLPPLPGATQLSGLQEQTERNTSDILKTLGEIPGGAEASAHLNRAATKMGYAIVSLRDKKLADAYDPHQTEALGALEAALAKLKEQQQQNQAKMDQQKKEKIREAFVNLRNDQLKVNDRTVKIDATKKLPDGSLPHVQQLDLNQLPGDQGKLADRAKKIGEDLAGISIIYQWANTDIVRSMQEIKDELAKPDAGKVTQAEQTRVVEQLQAMIDDLTVKPKDKFAQKGGDQKQGAAGGQGKKKKLPGEAELKLLKDLQLALNRATTKIELQGKQGEAKDNPRLAALGGRQGELRGLLDQMLKAAGGKGLPARPDKAEQLPEEAGTEQIEDQELEKNLLQDKPMEDKSEKDIGLVGDRMARSQQRLQEKFDPGKTTQKIQERIVKNMDDLIAMARQEQQQQQQSASKGQQDGDPQQGPAKPEPGEAQAQNQGQEKAVGQPQPAPSQTSAQNDSATASNENNAQLGNMKETADQWGQISPRLHDAVLEGAGEKVPEKYRKMVEDYYRSLATKATERK